MKKFARLIIAVGIGLLAGMLMLKSRPGNAPAGGFLAEAGAALHRTEYAAVSTGEALKSRLTELQYDVTKNEVTERAFSNVYWDNKQPGIYVDVVSGAPLFSSKEKFESGTGWPSFWKPLNDEEVVRKEDDGFWGARVEVRSKSGDAHLGHVFNDGPQPTGQRYCINSASLAFVPREKLEELGYGEYLSHFEE